MTLRRTIVYALLLAWSAVCLFPVFWLFATSLKSEADIFAKPSYLPFFDFVPSLDAWRFILLDASDGFLGPFFNSLLVSLSATLFAVLVAAMAIYGLTRMPSPETRRTAQQHASTLLLAMLATRIIPPVALVIPIYVMAQATHQLDSRFALALVYTAYNLPVAIWLLRPVLGNRASEPEEAAVMDGASHTAIFLTLLLPMARTGLVAVAALIFILCWNEYLFAAYLTSNDAVTLPVHVAEQMSMKEAQVGSEADEWAHFSAASVLAAAPVLLFTLLIQRHLGRLAVQRSG